MKPSIEFKETEQGTVAVLSGALTVQFAQDMKAALQKILDRDDVLTFILDNPESVDLSFLQLYWSFKKRCSDDNRVMHLKTILSEADTVLLTKTSLQTILFP